MSSVKKGETERKRRGRPVQTMTALELSHRSATLPPHWEGLTHRSAHALGSPWLYQERFVLTTNTKEGNHSHKKNMTYLAMILIPAEPRVLPFCSEVGVEIRRTTRELGEEEMNMEKGKLDHMRWGIMPNKKSTKIIRLCKSAIGSPQTKSQAKLQRITSSGRIKNPRDPKWSYLLKCEVLVPIEVRTSSKQTTSSQKGFHGEERQQANVQQRRRTQTVPSCVSSWVLTLKKSPQKTIILSVSQSVSQSVSSRHKWSKKCSDEKMMRSKVVP